MYYTQKFSSTVVTSLITGTPIVANQALLDAYTFLTRDAVLFQQEGQGELQAALSQHERILQTRVGLARLRQTLALQAREKLLGLMGLTAQQAQA